MDVQDPVGAASTSTTAATNATKDSPVSETSEASPVRVVGSLVQAAQEIASNTLPAVVGSLLATPPTDVQVTIDASILGTQAQTAPNPLQTTESLPSPASGARGVEPSLSRPLFEPHDEIGMEDLIPMPATPRPRTISLPPVDDDDLGGSFSRATRTGNRGPITSEPYPTQDRAQVILDAGRTASGLPSPSSSLLFLPPLDEELDYLQQPQDVPQPWSADYDDESTPPAWHIVEDQFYGNLEEPAPPDHFAPQPEDLLAVEILIVRTMVYVVVAWWWWW